MVVSGSSGLCVGPSPHGVPIDFDAVGIVNEAIEDGIGIGRIADHFMPSGSRKLTGHANAIEALNSQLIPSPNDPDSLRGFPPG